MEWTNGLWVFNGESKKRIGHPAPFPKELPYRAIKLFSYKIDQVILDVEPTIVCNAQGKQAVLMSLEEFNSWQETLYLLSNPANAEHLVESIKQAKSGNKVEEPS
jgi:antitoxin YefM